MYLKIRDINAKPGEKEQFINISKTAKIEEIKKIIQKERGIEIQSQRLLYKGKQLEDDLRVFDYDIQLNDVIQLLIKLLPSDSIVNNSKDNGSDEESSCSTSSFAFESYKPKERRKAESKYYKIGDVVDAHDPEYAAWFPGKIVDILENEDNSESKLNLENLIFIIQLDNLEHFADLEVEFRDIKPKSYYTYKKEELKEGMEVLVNYNIDEPTARGYWYNCILTEVTRTTVKGTLLVGREQAPLDDCIIKFTEEIFRLENPTLLTERVDTSNIKYPPKKTSHRCNNCKDAKNRKCKYCGCHTCGEKNRPDLILLCDECNYGYHVTCLTPPLENVPEDPEWYCPDCKVDDSEIVKAGEKLKYSKKKAKMASSKETNNGRDWGRGMACVGRTKECTLVPKDHYGPIPGVEVGTCWKFRLQVSEAGVHRPHVAGIHGRETDGAYSLVLSGGYEDDIDKGDEFYYTGSGGRDLSGNKRVSEQCYDQKLTRMNKALALNCNAEFNDKKGAEAKDWRKGKPVRVVRNYKLAKHSKYAPKDGNRYDGIYKVVKYYPEKGKSGYIVWRYLLRRDDPAPAPWSKNGKELEMLYPPGYIEAQEAEKKKAQEAEKAKEIEKQGLKRFLRESTSPNKSAKKVKVEPFKLDRKIEKLIKEDVTNSKLWNECKELLKEGKHKFLSKVEELFLCICCQDLIYLPVTTECKHNVCQSCLKRSFSAEIHACPYCRFELGKNYKMSVNEPLSDALKELFPGYAADR